MGKTYGRGYCWVCGEQISSAGFADYHHNMRHVREGLMIEHRRRYYHRVRGQERSYPAVEFERVKGIKLVQKFYFIHRDFDVRNKKHLDVYDETGRFIGAYKTLKAVRKAFDPFRNRIHRKRPHWWHYKRWKSHISAPPELEALVEQGIDYWFRQYFVTKVDNEN